MELHRHMEFSKQGAVLKYAYEYTFMQLVNLGAMLGFTWEQVVDAYYKKNKIDHERQTNGY